LNYTTPGRLGELSAAAERLNFVLVIGDLRASEAVINKIGRFTAFYQSIYNAMRAF